MKRLMMPLAAVVLGLGLSACEKTASQKVEDKVEDAGHNISQGAERAGEKVEDAAK